MQQLILNENPKPRHTGSVTKLKCSHSLFDQSHCECASEERLQ